MQWDASPGGGFTSGEEAWLPLVDAATRNVAAQSTDPASLLGLYRRLIAARREHPALGRGTQRSIFGVAPDVLAWVRELDGVRILVLLNVEDASRRCDLGTIPEGSGEVVIATSERTGRVSLASVELAPREGIALRL
jgi:glycosidase